MGLKDLEIGCCYETRNGVDVINDFYIPVLSQSISYDRIAGFFSSTSIAINSKGLYEIVKRKGKVRMLVSPILLDSDVKILNELMNDEIIYNSIDENVFLEEDEALRNHTKLFAWLLKEGFLEIKFVFMKGQDGLIMDSNGVERSGLFHQKIGILRDDEDNYLTFSGSINETAAAWLKNSEEFKAFKSWVLSHREICENDVKKFEEMWSGERDDLIVYEIPDAVNKRFLEIAPDNIDYIIDKIKKYTKKKRISLFFYQKDAMEKWKSSDKKLLFEMATGTGKTRTAIACIQNSLLEAPHKVIVIATPEITLSKQWKKEFDNLIDYDGKQFFLSGENDNWAKIEQEIYRIYRSASKSIVIYTTHRTCSSNRFIKLMQRLRSKKFKYVFVGDEVHKLGSIIMSNGLLNIYDERIGLSATPTRWFDEEGTDNLIDYFNRSSFIFSIKDALNTINPLTRKTFLTQYNYFPIMNELTMNEIEDYEVLTKQIKKNQWKEDNDNLKNSLQILRARRANILKNAESKINSLEKLIKKIGVDQISNCIIFVSPQQIDNVTKLLTKLRIQHAKFTENTGKIAKSQYNGKSEREHIIDRFKVGIIKILVAIKVLDEGIDIPMADTAILVSSTTNPREYIQRIGRVIRQYEEKVHANIYDFFVKAPNGIPSISNKEKDRVLYIAENALNSYSALKMFYGEET